MDKEIIRYAGDPRPMRSLIDVKPKPVQLTRISEHRAGRAKPLTVNQRRKRDRASRLALQARKKEWLDLQAFTAAL